MGRVRRNFISHEYGAYHIISRVAGGDLILDVEDKEYFVNLMFKLARGYYVDLISYTVMSNHFHILLRSRKEDSFIAPKEDLIFRYKSAFGEKAEYPEGSYIRDTFEIDYDEDGGIERLRRRLGSVSRYVQDLKQRFSKWYNKKYNRSGYLWGERFKGIVMSKGEAELICSAYIDLNSVRAGIVSRPEDYRWSSIGLRVRNGSKAKRLLKGIELRREKIVTFSDPNSGEIRQRTEKSEYELDFSEYMNFLYDSVNLKRDGSFEKSKGISTKSKSLYGKFGIGDILKYRFRNISEGIAFGTYEFVSEIQKKFNRKFIKPKKIVGNGEEEFYSTRKLNPI